MANDLALLESEAMREHLSAVPQLPALTGREAWIARGYADETGEPTKLGEDYLLLEDSGLFDQSGQLTPKGQAFAMDRDELLEESNLGSFIIADKEGLLDEEDVTFEGAVSGVAGMVGDAVSSAFRQNWNRMTAPFTDNGLAELAVEQDAALAGAVKGSALLGAGMQRTAEKLWLDSEEDQTALALGKQSYLRAKRDITDMKAAEFVGGLLGSAEVLETMEGMKMLAEAKVGEERGAELNRQGEAFGSIALDPANYLTAGAGMFFSKAARGPSLFAKLSARVDDAAAATAEATRNTARASLAKSLVEKSQATAEASLARASQLEGVGDVAGASQARIFGERATMRNVRAQSLLAKAEVEAGESAARAESLAAKVGGAPRILAAMETAKQVKALPFSVTAEALERTGALLTKGNDALQDALIAVGATKEGLTTAKWIGGALGVTVNPGFLGIPAMLAAGPVLKNVGNLSRIVGKEVIQARGSLPFWRRVAQNSAAGPVTIAAGRMLDNLTLGGKVFRPVGVGVNALKGASVAFPMNLGFEVLAEGGEINQNVINRAAAGSLVFAATGAAMGSLVNGSLQSKQRQMMGDEINFRNALPQSEKLAFNSLGKGARRVASTYAAANPGVTVKLGKGGVSRYDHDSKTAYINTDSGNPLRPLVTHEMLHHTLAKGQMEAGIQAMLVGQPGVGGLFRSADGALAPEFKAAMDSYNGRLAADGVRARTPEEFAVEYFIEAGVDHVLGLADSGKLSEYAGRSTVERFVRSMVEETISRTPFVRDLFFKMGGAIDGRGQMVQGNGLLADGIREIPGAKKMLSDLLKKQAGSTSPAAKKLGKKGDDGSPMVITKENRAGVEAMFSDLKTDADGRPILDADGNPQFIDRETYVKRSMVGRDIVEKAAEDIRQGIAQPEGSLKPDGKGSWTGTHLTPEQLTMLGDSSLYNRKQMAVIRMLNHAAKTQGGESFGMIYQPAIKTSLLGKKVYASIPATFREVVPVGVKVTKDGNIIVETMSVTQLMKNVNERAGHKRGQKLYRGDVKEILKDLEQVMERHRHMTEPGPEVLQYFAKKYGAENAVEYRQFINTCMGLIQKSQQDVNPMFMEDSIRGDTNIFKSRRIDRINQTSRLQGPISFFYGHEQVKGNWFPNGVPGGKRGGMDLSFLDQELAAPPQLKEDFRQAWEYGAKTQGMSVYEAAMATPEWVFNFGRETNEFWEAGRRGESPEFVVGFRHGPIPERGHSMNWASNEAEPGVSLAYAHNRNDMELNAMTMIGVGGRKKTYVRGWAFPKSRWGSDGEIVILGAEEIKPPARQKPQ